MKAEEDLFAWTHARANDRATSHSAANDTKFRAPKTKLKILRVLYEHGPMTPDEVMHILGADCHQRFSDLANIDHLIDDTGLVRPSDRGSSMVVWAINPKGVERLRPGLEIEIN